MSIPFPGVDAEKATCTQLPGADRSDGLWQKYCTRLGMRWRTDLRGRVFAFAVSIIKLHREISLLGEPQAHIAKQLSRCATAIGALLEEANVALSRRDMASKQAIALREARESVYWLKLLVESGEHPAELDKLQQEAEEFVAMLTTSVKKLRADENCA